MDFEAYLISKKIDSAQFATAEAKLWTAWKFEFDQVHPNSFTAQKLYLINPVRRKYPLKIEVVVKAEKEPDPMPEKTLTSPELSPAPVLPKPAVPRPVFKPKPKIS